MLGLIIAVIAVSFLVFAAWLLGLTAPIEARIRVGSVERRKNRALRAIRAEGQATRELIRTASRQGTKVSLDRWLAQERSRRTQTRWLIVGIGASCLVLIIIFAILFPFDESQRAKGPSRRALLDSAILRAAKGDCTNFTNDYQTNVLPKHPKIVPCTDRDANFKVAWRGASPADGYPCPARYSRLASWTDNSGLTICMDRNYRVQQCMQGGRVKDAAYDWYDEAVVPCSLAPTAKYPYIVKIVWVYHSDRFSSCPGNSSAETNPDDARRLVLCIKLWRRY